MPLNHSAAEKELQSFYGKEETGLKLERSTLSIEKWIDINVQLLFEAVRKEARSPERE